MCLGIPGKIVDITGEGVFRTGNVDFDGIVKTVNLAYVPEAEIGDYAIVHVGFAITQLDERAALETLAHLQKIEAVEVELDPARALAAEEAIVSEES
jgi:hydrogenase expression/formation protein HypC